jgi:hypothetical protein
LASPWRADSPRFEHLIREGIVQDLFDRTALRTARLYLELYDEDTYRQLYFRKREVDELGSGLGDKFWKALRVAQRGRNPSRSLSEVELEDELSSLLRPDPLFAAGQEL